MSIDYISILHKKAYTVPPNEWISSVNAYFRMIIEKTYDLQVRHQIREIFILVLQDPRMNELDESILEFIFFDNDMITYIDVQLILSRLENRLSCIDIIDAIDLKRQLQP